MSLPINIKEPFLDDSETLTPSKKHELYAIPPSIELGKKHGLACKISKIKSRSNIKEYCPCCSKPITYDQIDGTEKDLGLLGESFVIYFNFLKLCMILLVVMWTIIGIPTLMVSLISNKGPIINSGISGLYIGSFITLTQDNNQKIINSLLQIIFVFASFSIHKWMSINHKKVIDEYHDEIIQASDYAILVIKLKGLNYTKQELILFIESFLEPSDQSAINEIILGHDIEYLIKLYNQKNIIRTKIAKSSKINKDSKSLKNLNQDYNRLQMNIAILKKRFLTIINDGVYNTESVIIIFNDSKNLREFSESLIII